MSGIVAQHRFEPPCAGGESRTGAWEFDPPLQALLVA